MLISIALLFSLAAAAPAADEVTYLPGWSKELPSKIYSGFISGGNDTQDEKKYSMKMWYMFVEAEESPETAPVILWSNGGPGASSAYGLFTELGPFYLSSESLATSPPTLFRNPYSWSKLANVLILNGPAPVGYSYCLPSGPAGDGYSCGQWNDTRTNDHNVEFLNNWAAAFPEYQRNPLYIAGESYAGVYTGMLVSSLLNASTPLNLRGLALGDACMGTDVLCGAGEPQGPWLSLLFEAGQGCISLPTFEAILQLCPMAVLKTGPVSALPAACQAAIAAAAQECPGNAYYAYNYLDQCPPDPFNAQAVGDVPPPPKPSGYPCGGDGALKQWITSPETKAALHIAPEATYNSFDNGQGFVYNLTWSSNLPLLRRLQSGADGVKVLIYNGETDPSVSSVKSQVYSFGLDFPVRKSWRPWTYGAEGPGVVAGQIVQWEGNISHATIRGSGHMVPGYKPYSAYLLMQHFLEDGDDVWPELPASGSKRYTTPF